MLFCPAMAIQRSKQYLWTINAKRFDLLSFSDMNFFLNRKIQIPDPLIIAIVLTLLTMVLVLFFGNQPTEQGNIFFKILIWWKKGIWELLAFTMQMILILMLGHILALSPALQSTSNFLSKLASKPLHAVLTVLVSAILTAWLNWGLSLVFSAILAKKIYDQAVQNSLRINYPLLGASAYVSMMVWHGGLSGSAPLSIASEGHFLVQKTGIVPINETIFSSMNLVANLALFILLIVLAWYLTRKKTPDFRYAIARHDVQVSLKPASGFRFTLITLTGLLLMAALIIEIISKGANASFGLNEVNLLLLALVMLAFHNKNELSEAAAISIRSTAGIALQFPLYAGIMGLMNHSGLLQTMTQWFISVSSVASFPLLTFLSAALVNLFVPSGGGQWAVQGPLIMDAASALGVAPSKAVMALAYGDQVTNMVQPFWALPLLAITGLKAGDILRYSLLFMLPGFLVFGLVLWFF